MVMMTAHPVIVAVIKEDTIATVYCVSVVGKFVYLFQF